MCEDVFDAIFVIDINVSFIIGHNKSGYILRVSVSPTHRCVIGSILI